LANTVNENFIIIRFHTNYFLNNISFIAKEGMLAKSYMIYKSYSGSFWGRGGVDRSVVKIFKTSFLNEKSVFSVFNMKIDLQPKVTNGPTFTSLLCPKTRLRHSQNDNFHRYKNLKK